MMKWLWMCMVAFAGFSGAGGALAQTLAPDALVQNVTEEVLASIRQDKDIQAGDSRKINALVRTKVLPYFDFQRMTALAVGRDWNKASPQQKEQLVDQFRELLVRTYSNALTSYKDEKVRYKPLKMAEGATEVLVRTEVLKAGGRPIQLDYSLARAEQGWKVFDVVVAGVSLVTNYRDSFSQEIRAGGIEGLIRALETKNKSLAAAAGGAGR